MGAWIEIHTDSYRFAQKVRSHPTMGAWIEIHHITKTIMQSHKSHPTMGAWIEILNPYEIFKFDKVAPHDGCVD